MDLRAQLTAKQAITALERLMAELQDIAVWGKSDSIEDDRDRYLSWVTKAEQQLRYVFTSPEPADALHSARYGLLFQLTSKSPRPREIINAEIDFQYGRLQQLVRRLARYASLADRPGTVIVLDTNVLLHYRKFDHIDWPRVLEVERVRLLLPLAVIEELDAKKYSRRKDLRGRAAKVLAALCRYLENSPGTLTAISSKVTIETLSDGPDEVKYASGQDSVILAFSQWFQQVTGQPVTIVTADQSMRIRALALGLKVWRMPADLINPLTNDDDGDEA